MLFSATSALVLGAVYMILRVQGSGGSFPRPLTATEEREYVQRMLDNDSQARSLLIEHNLRLVAHIVKKYYSDPSDQDDLISIGTIGLIKAVNTYKPDKNVKLATYAARCIENAMLSQRRRMWVLCIAGQKRSMPAKQSCRHALFLFLIISWFAAKRRS